MPSPPSVLCRTGRYGARPPSKFSQMNQHN
jgi:hypothetical protein